MDNGWIKMYRSLLEDPIWLLSSPEQKSILITVLLMVNHEEKEWDYNGEKFICNPGQTVTSLQKIAEATGKGISTQNVRTALLRFEKLNFLTCKPTNRFRVITICKWVDYQAENNTPNRAPNKHLTSTQQAPNKHLTTNKNDKNVRMKEYKNAILTDCVENEPLKNDLSAEDVKNEWNKTCPNSPSVTRLSEDRKRKIKLRLAEMGGGEEAAEKLKTILEKINASDYLQGKIKKWRATFDWLFDNGNNWVKVYEGNYDNSEPTTLPFSPRKGRSFGGGTGEIPIDGY